MNTPYGCGIITNYVCTASCRHCMFGSSPRCPKNYISPETAESVASLLEESGASSVHIGGGEPFMNFSALLTTVDALHRHGIEVDYIETNAFWAKDDAIVRDRLAALRGHGVTTIMVSCDPFHLEFVPLGRVVKLINCLNEANFDYFIWQERYLRRLLRLDHDRTYSHAELSAILGDDYVEETAREYGLGMNGRALAIASRLYPKQPAEVYLAAPSCRILSPSHAHFDLHGNAVPSGCPGLVAPMRAYLTAAIDATTHPVFHALTHGGVGALYKYAAAHGFTADADGYPTKCAFCYAMRSYLLKTAPTADLSPVCFYDEIDALTR